MDRLPNGQVIDTFLAEDFPFGAFTDAVFQRCQLVSPTATFFDLFNDVGNELMGHLKGPPPEEEREIEDLDTAERQNEQIQPSSLGEVADLGGSSSKLNGSDSL